MDRLSFKNSCPKVWPTSIEKNIWILNTYTFACFKVLSNTFIVLDYIFNTVYDISTKTDKTIDKIWEVKMAVITV